MPRASSPSTSDTVYASLTSPLPTPPAIKSYEPVPNAATRAVDGMGKVADAFLSSTTPSAAACLAWRALAGKSGVSVRKWSLAVSDRNTTSKMSRTLRSSTASSRSPQSSAVRMASVRSGIPGMSSSFPAFIWATASNPPNQSVMTTPSKPHS